MSRGINPDFLRDNYARMSDNELTYIATQDAAGLTPEAMSILKEEIHKRGLGDDIAKGIDAQNKQYSIEELKAYCDIISTLNCPHCNNNTEKLSATVTAMTISLVVITNYEKRVRVGCPSCLKKKNATALIGSLVIGWWGIPWGPIRTLQSVWINISNMGLHKPDEYNDYMYGYVLTNLGRIEVYKNDRAKLQEILKNS